MTRNQIEFWNLQESKRHNLRTEGQTDSSLKETSRHNLAQENFNLSSLGETKRHNIAQEQESQRHNIAGERFNLDSLAETKRHNEANEKKDILNLQENIRHNKSTESLNLLELNVDKAYKEAQTLLRNKELSFAQEKEVQRITESLRDFQETVRYHNLSSVTNSQLTKLLGNTLLPLFNGGAMGVPKLNPGVGAFLMPPASAGILESIGGAAKSLLSTITDMGPIIMKQIFPDTIKPGNQNGGHIG